MNENATFLLVEDDAADAMLLRRAFTKARIINPIHLVTSAEEAVEYLTGVGRYQNRAEFPLPAIILLDLNLPGMNGHQFLKWLRAQPGLDRLRVVVLSGSNDIRDINLAYQYGVNSFLVKPTDFHRFVTISQALCGYWLWLDQSPETVRPLYNLSQPPARVQPNQADTFS